MELISSRSMTSLLPGNFIMSITFNIGFVIVIQGWIDWFVFKMKTYKVESQNFIDPVLAKP